MNCPRCHSPLELQHIRDRSEEIEVDQCPQCQGIWFDKGELTHLESIVEQVLIEIRNIPKKFDQLTGLYCPSCPDKTLMKKVEHSRDQKVIMDFCENCDGSWLDGGELTAIQKENWFSVIVNAVKQLHQSS